MHNVNCCSVKQPAGTDCNRQKATEGKTFGGLQRRRATRIRAGSWGGRRDADAAARRASMRAMCIRVRAGRSSKTNVVLAACQRVATGGTSSTSSKAGASRRTRRSIGVLRAASGDGSAAERIARRATNTAAGRRGVRAMCVLRDCIAARGKVDVVLVAGQRVAIDVTSSAGGEHSRFGQALCRRGVLRRARRRCLVAETRSSTAAQTTARSRSVRTVGVLRGLVASSRKAKVVGAALECVARRIIGGASRREVRALEQAGSVRAVLRRACRCS